jgi:hypothetical protein
MMCNYQDKVVSFRSLMCACDEEVGCNKIGLSRLQEEKIAVPLACLIAHLYRFEGTIVILKKLYPTIINRSTMSCKQTPLFGPERIDFLCL